MDETMERPGVGRWDAVFAAAMASGEIWDALAPDDESGVAFDRAAAHSWEGLGHEKPHSDNACAYLGAFVRLHPEAPAEALYRFGSANGIHDGPPDGWADLPLHARAAYTAFREVLLLLDRLVAAERPAEAPPAPVRPDREGDIEETIFAQGRAPMDVDPALARDLDRPVRIIPAEGDPPGHSREARPRAALGVPIGPENTMLIRDNRILSQAEFLARDERPATEG